MILLFLSTEMNSLCTRGQEEEKSANRYKHWTAGNRIKIRRYFCINLPLKDGGGL